MLTALKNIWNWLWKYRQYVIPIIQYLIKLINKKKMKTENENLLTDKQVKELAKLLDKAVKFKGILEIVDGIAFKIIIGLANQYGSSAIKKEYRDKLSILITQVLAGEWDAAETETAIILNSLVDIPGIDEDTELSLFKSVIEVIVKLIKQLVSSKRIEAETTPE